MKRYLSVGLTQLIVFASFAQTSGWEARLFAARHIRERKTYRYTIGADGSQGARVWVYDVTYNSEGHPLVQRRFGVDGKVTDKYVSEYLGDSLEVRMVSYAGEDKESSEITNQYDDRGYQTYHKQVVKNNGMAFEQFRVYNAAGQNTELYNSANGENRWLAGRWEYDPAGRQIREMMAYSRSKPMDTTYIDLDEHGNRIRGYSKAGDSILLKFETSYNSFGLPVERRSYFQVPAKILDHSQETKKLDQGDVLVVTFTYDDQGLVTGEVQSRNGKPVTKIEYEYL